jgi:purine-nucleoside phosphorylase
MLLSDHINYNGLNPLIGEKTDARFVPMTDAHSPALRAALRRRRRPRASPCPKASMPGIPAPRFETPAEIRMLKLLGADAVGMSTVPEVILARFLGLEVAAISTITNMAAGMSDERSATSIPRPWPRWVRQNWNASCGDTCAPALSAKVV